jgi:hypothetical protein
MHLWEESGRCVPDRFQVDPTKDAAEWREEAATWQRQWDCSLSDDDVETAVAKSLALKGTAESAYGQVFDSGL